MISIGAVVTCQIRDATQAAESLGTYIAAARAARLNGSRRESSSATKMPLADELRPPYIAPSLGDGPATGAAETQVATDQEETRRLKTPCFRRRLHIISALQSNRRKR